jgi:hypothetical protein
MFWKKKVKRKDVKILWHVISYYMDYRSDFEQVIYWRRGARGSVVGW